MYQLGLRSRDSGRGEGFVAADGASGRRVVIVVTTFTPALAVSSMQEGGSAAGTWARGRGGIGVARGYVVTVPRPFIVVGVIVPYYCASE